ncbi:WD_REPEATS_REGION domain-containing protein [Mortierella sp. 14UC]|nr:WD_REPEATS_REGION domain-containing protein [Mortierella sp. 14UC]
MTNNPSKRPLSNSGDAVDPNTTQPDRKRDRTDEQSNVITKGSQPISFEATVDPLLVTAKSSTQDAPSCLENDLLALKAQRLEEYRQPVYISPMAKAGLLARDNDLFPLMDKVQEFLASERQVMLILGDAGSGKSTFDRHLEHALWTSYTIGGPIPLFINLPVIDQPGQDMIEKQLTFLNFEDDQIQELKLYRRFVLICDGYDESQQLGNLYMTNKLNQPGQWSAKMVISCRSQYLGQDYRSRFMPQSGGHYSRPATELFQEAVITPFSRDQIKSYVEQYIPLEPRTWITHDYMYRLTAIPHLMDLVKNPFLLTLALETLPAVTEGKEDMSAIRLTRVQLYDAFVVHWLSVNKRRLQDSTLSAYERDVFELLLDAGFISMGIQYSTRLASAIFEKQNGRPIVKYIQRQDGESWRAEFFGPELKVRFLRESSPLTSAGDLHQFVHRSMLEYFFSRAVFDPSNSADCDEFAPQADYGSSVTQSLDPNGPLFSRNLLEEPSVVEFLYERVPHNSFFKKQLLAVVEQSKLDPGYSQAAANAMTILVKARVRFNGADLRNINIPGADLFGGQFDSAQFQGADLTNVNLTRSWIRQADFTGAAMADVRLGVLPSMSESCSVCCCAFSSDGTLLAAGLEDGRISLYDALTWTKSVTLLGHSSRVTSVAFSPTGTWLASGSHDSTIRLWDPETCQLIWTLEGHTEKVLDIAYSPNGSKVASASKDKTVRVWDLESGETELLFESHEGAVTSLSWSPDGARIVSGSHDKTIQVWDSLEGSEVVPRQYDESDSGIDCVEFSPDGQWIICGNQDRQLVLRKATNGEQEDILGELHGRLRSVVFSQNGRWMATCSFRFVKLWDTDTFTERASWKNHSRVVRGAAFSADSSQIVSCGSDRTIHRADLSTIDTDLNSQDDFDDVSEITTIAFSPNSLQAASGSDDYSVRLWDIRTGDLAATLTGHSYDIAKLSFSPDGTTIASGSGDYTVRLWDTQTGIPGVIFKEHTNSVRCLSFSPCGQWIASGGYDKRVQIRQVHPVEPTTRMSRCLEDFIGPVVSLAWNPSKRDQFDHLELATGSSDGSIRVWRLSVEEVGVRICLVWGTHVAELFPTDANIMGAIELSEQNRKYLVQRGASGEYSVSDTDESSEDLEFESESEGVESDIDRDEFGSEDEFGAEGDQECPVEDDLGGDDDMVGEDAWESEDESERELESGEED